MRTGAPRSSTRVAAAWLALAMLAGAGAAAAANGCATNFSDRRTANPVIVQAAMFGFDFTPRCARVAQGATVRFTGDFNDHPTFGGLVIDDVATSDPNSPIGPWLTGMQHEFVAVDVVELPYYCDTHFASPLNMKGSILVVPEYFADGLEDPPAP